MRGRGKEEGSKKKGVRISQVICNRSQTEATASSIWDPMGAAMYLTPDLLRRRTLSMNGKKASELTATSLRPDSHSALSSWVKTFGTS